MPTLTPIPGIQATLTALPKQPPLSPDQARPYQELRAAVEQCNAYNQNRKIGILSQIDYLLQPATAPSELVVLYGDEWQGRLLYGAAYLSALEWKLAGRDRSKLPLPHRRFVQCTAARIASDYLPGIRVTGMAAAPRVAHRRPCFGCWKYLRGFSDLEGILFVLWYNHRP